MAKIERWKKFENSVDFVRINWYILIVQHVRTNSKKGDETMSPLKGQKLTDTPKDKRVEIRMDEETAEKLDFLVEVQGSDRSKVIREGIEIQYKKAKRNKK